MSSLIYCQKLGFRSVQRQFNHREWKLQCIYSKKKLENLANLKFWLLLKIWDLHLKIRLGHSNHLSSQFERGLSFCSKRTRGSTIPRLIPPKKLSCPLCELEFKHLEHLQWHISGHLPFCLELGDDDNPDEGTAFRATTWMRRGRQNRRRRIR